MLSHRHLLRLGLLVCLTLCCTGIFAQQGIVRIDRVSPLFHGDTVHSGVPVRFVLRYINNTSTPVDVSNGFRISTPDGAAWDSITLAPVGPKDGDGQTAFTRYFDILTSGEMQMKDLTPSSDDFVYFVGGGNHHDPHQLPVGFDDTVLAVTLWFNSDGNNLKHICFDSSFYSPSGTWVWAGRDMVDYHPEFLGLPGQVSGYSGYCFFLYQLPCWYGPCCCQGYGVGNVNMIGIVDLADLSALIGYLTGSGYRLPCDGTANVNGLGIVDLADLSALINYLTGGGFVLPNC